MEINRKAKEFHDALEILGEGGFLITVLANTNNVPTALRIVKNIFKEQLITHRKIKDDLFLIFRDEKSAKQFKSMGFIKSKNVWITADCPNFFSFRFIKGASIKDPTAFGKHLHPSFTYFEKLDEDLILSFKEYPPVLQNNKQIFVNGNKVLLFNRLKNTKTKRKIVWVEKRIAEEYKTLRRFNFPVEVALKIASKKKTVTEQAHDLLQEVFSSDTRNTKFNTNDLGSRVSVSHKQGKYAAFLSAISNDGSVSVKYDNEYYENVSAELVELINGDHILIAESP